jgi:hypothetical protein
MLYRSKNYGLVVIAVVVALVGAYSSTRADEPSNDLELQLKQKEAQYKELEQKIKAERDRAFDHSKQANEQARQIAEQARQPAEQFRFTLGQPGMRTRVEPSAAEAIHKAAADVRDAKGDDEKSAAQKKLNEALSKYFDEDMVQREKELKQVEERVTKLRELLDRRRTNKQEIIDLEAKVALNQANGLGFYDGETPGGGWPNPFGWGGYTGKVTGGGGFGGSASGAVAIPAPVPAVAPVPPVPPVAPIDVKVH